MSRSTSQLISHHKTTCWVTCEKTIAAVRHMSSSDLTGLPSSTMICGFSLRLRARILRRNKFSKLRPPRKALFSLSGWWQFQTRA